MKKILFALALLPSLDGWAVEKSNHFFRNGINSPVFGELYLTEKNSDTREGALVGFKIGVQVARFADWASLAGGYHFEFERNANGFAANGPMLEAIALPGKMFHASLSYSALGGDYTNKADRGGEPLKFNGADMLVAAHYLFMYEKVITIGMQSSAFTLKGQSTSESANGFFIGFRGTTF